MIRNVIPSERSEPSSLAASRGTHGRARVVVAALFCVFASTCALAAAPPDPSVRLYDTKFPGSGSAPYDSLPPTSIWEQVAENTVERTFRGHAAVMNNRVALLVYTSEKSPELYVAGRGGYSRKATLWAGPGSGCARSIRVIENTSAAVELEVTFTSAGTERTKCRFRLTAGEPFVEVRTGEGAESVCVGGPTEQLPAFRRGGCAVVPEFFGDDVAVYGHGQDLPSAPMPAENLLLLMLHPWGGVLMCVWESAEQPVSLSHTPLSILTQEVGQSGPGVCRHENVLSGCRIVSQRDKRVWISHVPGLSVWHQYHVGDADKPLDVLRNFQPPFPAKWRASFVGTDGVCESITFEKPPEKAPVPDDWRGPVIIYPIDRSRDTPLTTILPMDILRSTLGVGPCEYILDVEGLGGDDPAPPDAVLAWIERLIKKKRAARSAEEIKERLDAMLAHLAAARKRIDDYAAFGRQVRHVCRQAKNEADAEAQDAKAVLAICDRLDHDLERGRLGMRTHEDAARLVREITALLEKADALAALEAPAKALRAVGAAHDATLARSRMAARRMKATCRGLKSDLAGKVETMAERMLRPSK